MSLFSITVNTDVDTEVFIDEADAKTYYNPRWKNPRTNTGYFFVERDTTFTVTYLEDNPAGDNIRLNITLTPYRLQADGSYVSALENALFHPMMGHNSSYVEPDYIYYCTDGTFHPQSECSLNSNYSTKPGAVLYTRETLKPGESATFTIPFDRFGDDADLMYEVEASISYPKSDGSSSSSYRYTRVILDEEAVAQMRAEQSGAVKPETPVATTVTYSDWAAQDILDAVSYGYIYGTDSGKPAVTDLLGSDYTKAITRAQFASIAVRLYETRLAMDGIDGTIPVATGDDVFADSQSNEAIAKAYNLGILGGYNSASTRAGIYVGPDDLITREQASTMLTRLMAKLDEDLGRSMLDRMTGVTLPFVDTISDWALDSVETVYKAGVMNGTSGTTFSAKSNYTIEQSIVTVMRISEWSMMGGDFDY